MVPLSATSLVAIVSLLSGAAASGMTGIRLQTIRVDAQGDNILIPFLAGPGHQRGGAPW
jgi:hypothetical protein